jgi:transcriptional regulator with XRE-family HTH domain
MIAGAAATGGGAMDRAFGDILKEWRRLRRLSQLELALSAGASARHLSFLESGRARPSREMILRLASALDMPRAVVNRALHAAGFAPVYPALPLSAPDLAPVRGAIETMLANHEPMPAFAIDRGWNLIGANGAARRLFAAVSPTAPANVIDLLLSLADGDRIENWEETAGLALQRLRAEIAHFGGDAPLEARLRALAAHPRLQPRAPVAQDRVVIPMTLRVGPSRLSVFTVIAAFTAVEDVAASEIRIELMFPADEATRAHFAANAA